LLFHFDEARHFERSYIKYFLLINSLSGGFWKYFKKCENGIKVCYAIFAIKKIKK